MTVSGYDSISYIFLRMALLAAMRLAGARAPSRRLPSRPLATVSVPQRTPV